MGQQLEAAVDVVLQGGPQGVTPVGVSLAGQDRLKIPHRGGYEHFERLVGAGPAVFQWVARTKLAE